MEPGKKKFVFLCAAECSYLSISVTLSIQNPSPSFTGATVVRTVEVLHTGICFGGICHQHTGTRTLNQREQELA